MKTKIFALLLLLLPTFLTAEVSIRIKSNYETGVQMFQQGNMEMALTFFRQGAEKGEADSQSALGTHYFYGDGVEKDIAKALELFEKSAVQGDGLGNAMLGVIYSRGEDVEPDQEKAFAHSLKAAKICIAQSQDFVAMHLYYGKGIERNIAEALSWLYMSTSLGYEPSQDGVTQIESEVDEKTKSDAKKRFEKLKSELKCVGDE